MTQTYTAITIGPIYPTFAQAKKTRAVWAASYFFSWFTKQLILHTKDLGVRLPDTEEHLSEHGSGLYADRVYYASEDNIEDKIQAATQTIIDELAKDIGGDTTADFLKHYLHIHIVSLPKAEDINENAYPLDEMNQLLDHKELLQNYVFDIEKNPLIDYLSKPLKDNSILKVAAFGESKQRQFRSLPEIASTSLQRIYQKQYKEALIKDFNDETTDLFIEIKKALQKYKAESIIYPHHKYYAILYADGDNISAVLENVKNDKDKLVCFSKKLFEFGKKAEKSIAQYGGNGIYLGGEDILAFAPIACVKEDGTGVQSFFDLIAQLDKDFKTTVGLFANDIGVAMPTLSYGIILSYYKHPLKEALKYAHNLLDGKAKKVEGKNSIAITLRKHSGQMMECVIQKQNAVSYAALLDMIKEGIDKDSEDFLSSIMHRFNDDLFFDLFSKSVEADMAETNPEKKLRVTAFFDNFFNEAIHKEKNSFIEKINAFSYKLFEEYTNAESRKTILFFVLRYIHFINSKNER